ncbi:MAG: amylosucrase [Rhodothermia bacterium]|nr:amylosucrase [Rhodothermia bacterium]
MHGAIRQHLDRWLTSSKATLIEERPEIKERIDAHFGDFYEAYQRLYGHLPDTQDRVTRLFKTLLDGAEARAADLVELDMRRYHDPNWFKDRRMVGIMMYVDLFAGNLNGVESRIDYLRELGVTYLHLMPLLKSRPGQNDGGYAVSDFRKVNPSLGSMDDLRQLAKELRLAGISLAIDFVMNHTAREHDWAQRALRGNEQHQDFYLMFEDRRLPDSFEKTLPEVFPDFSPGNFTYVPELRKWVWTTFYDFQWDLNYKNPDVFEAMLGEMLFLANAGADVLRLDAVPFTWKRMGTNCQNQIEAVVLLVAYRALMRIAAPAVAFKAEAIVAPDDIIRYLGVGGYEGRACDIAYNATLMNHLWHALACENTQLLRTTLQNLPPAPDDTAWINYIRCHDDIGWGISDANAEAVHQSGPDTRRFCTDFYSGRLANTYAEGYRFQSDPDTGEARISGTAAALTGLQKAIVEGDEDAAKLALERLLLLKGVMYFMKGIPLLYSGDEIGQLNDYRYLDDPHKKPDNRWVHRPPMDWTRAELRHQPGTIEHTLFHSIQRLAAARISCKALDGSSSQEIVSVPNDSLFVVERQHGAEAALLVANLSSASQRVDLSDLPSQWQNGRYREVITDELLTFTFGDLALGPYECLWLTHPHARGREKAVPVTITIDVETRFGEMVYITGNIPELGEWRGDHAVGPLDPTDYPTWTGRFMIREGTVFSYTWVKRRDGEVVEAGSETHFMRARNAPTTRSTP